MSVPRCEEPVLRAASRGLEGKLTNRGHACARAVGENRCPSGVNRDDMHYAVSQGKSAMAPEARP